MNNDLVAIRRLVGAVTKEQLKHVDCFVARELALFMPVGGACLYARTPEHTHPTYMFVLPFNEQLSTNINGRVLPGRPGKVFALSPDIPHQELPTDSPPRYIAVMISKRFFAKHYRFYSRKEAPVFPGSFFDPDDGLLPLLKRFMIETERGAAGSEAVLDALGVEICHSLIRAIVKAPAAKTRVADRVEIGRVIEYLFSHLGDKITIDVLADVAHLSPSHFSRVFKDDIGKAPMEYVQDLRLERAKKLLLAGDRTITEIALECGFNSSSYLSSCFHKHYKMTPSEYLKEARR